MFVAVRQYICVNKFPNDVFDLQFKKECLCKIMFDK